jgi:hypothetical protein
MDALVVAQKNATLVDLERDCSYLFMPTLQRCSLLNYRNTLFWTDSLPQTACLRSARLFAESLYRADAV